MTALLVIAVVILLGAAYVFYSRILQRVVGADDARPTPACAINDGVDFVPVKASMLIGQHFSAIAAAGPIVGPVLAGLWFGWVPALLWIVIGSIFIGGVHDYFSLFVSVRHKAASIGAIVRQHMSVTSQRLFLVFVWFALVYVIIAFTDITAQTFKTVARGEAFGPGVAYSSVIYLAVGMTMGLVLRYTRMNLKLATVLFLALVVVTIWVGTQLPAGLAAIIGAIPLKGWDLILLAYCFAASLLPMWLLLQPRGYLGGWFLYLTIAICLFGALAGGFAVRYPAFNLDGFTSLATGKLIFPILFITVACGACSGFHGIVSAGTTSKQIMRESDTRVVGYGAMLLEGLVAVLALVTVMILAPGDQMLKQAPNLIYANGIAEYMSLLKVGYWLALPFALLAFSTFVYDTLDVCTRLARYILQEMFGWESKAGALAATAITMVLPVAFLMRSGKDAYLVAWPIFGTSNQLLASLTLLALSVWLIRTGRRAIYTIIPMVFMLVVTLWSLVLQIKPFAVAMVMRRMPALTQTVVVGGVCGVILLVLSVWLIAEAVRVLAVRKTEPSPT